MAATPLCMSSHLEAGTRYRPFLWSKTLTERLLPRHAAVRTVRGMEQTENQLQRLLQLVESAQRAGHSENEIAQLVDDAIDADVELDAAA